MLAAILIFRWRDGGLELGWWSLPLFVAIVFVVLLAHVARGSVPKNHG